MSDQLIYKKMASILREVNVINKGSKNTQQNFFYRSIDDVVAELHDVFAKHEVFITHEVMERKREERSSKNGGILIYSIITFRFKFWTVDGSYVSTEMEGEAMDSGDKSSNKAVSVALKYALVNTFLIPTKEGKKREPDASSPSITKGVELAVPKESSDKIKNTKTEVELIALCSKLKKELGPKYEKSLTTILKDQREFLKEAKEVS